MREEQIVESLRRRYAEVAAQPSGQFAYPTGRRSAGGLCYRNDLVARVPAEVVEHFVGVGNPFSLGEPEVGWHVVDVGCGCGFDCQIAAHFVGSTGGVIGVDISPEMLDVARRGLQGTGLHNLMFVEGRAEALPVEPEWADLVVSNGVLNLATCKEAAFHEVARVLRSGGRFQAADLVLVKELPADLRDDEFAWSN